MCNSATCPNNKSGIGADFMCNCKPDVIDYHDFCNINTPKEERSKLNIGDIYDNSIRCKICNNTIRSKNAHHMAWCACKACAVDGGSFYTKIVGELKDIEIKTIMFSDIDED